MVTYVDLGTPAFLDGVTFDANEARIALGGLVSSAGQNSGIVKRSGILPSIQTAGQVAAAGGMNITVDPATFAIQGTDSTTQGVYYAVVSTQQTLTVTASSPSLPRIDSVCVTVDDNGDSSSTCRLQIVAGTPGASPSAPTLPTNSTKVADIAVGAGVTSITAGNITDTRVWTVATGGVLPVASSSAYPSYSHHGGTIYDQAKDEFKVFKNNLAYVPRAFAICTSSTRPTNVFTGSEIYETDTGIRRFWDGTAWIGLYNDKGHWSCTSASRPTDPSTGTTIWETDTKRTYIYDGTRWVPLMERLYTSYTPTWTASGTAPSLGTGSISGQYALLGGNTVRVKGYLGYGGTTTGGTGYWKFSLPTECPVDMSGVSLDIGQARIQDTGTASYNATVEPSTTTTIQIWTNASGNPVGPTVPMTWADTDYLRWNFVYETTVF